jgi:DNA topoisomerase-1
MSLAQDLYEKGYITYMRTDSYNVSAEFANNATTHIRQTYGAEYVGNKVNNENKGKKKHAQEAHEAIRPTHVEDVQLDDKEITKDHKKLYELIWKRALAYFMSPALFDELEVKITDSGLKANMYFLSSFKRLKFSGFLAVYGEKASTSNDLDSMIDAMKAHKYNIKDDSIIGKNTWTSPPARYSEASIIKTLEAESIGRPSTFAAILTKLFEKQYILKSDVRGEDKQTKNIILEKGNLKVESTIITVGDEKSKLVPSNIGCSVDEFLQHNFAYIIDKHFTAAMEEDLDKIANGDTSRNHVLSTFWKTFSIDVEKVESIKKAAKVKLQNEELKYNIDGKEYIVRVAKYGPVVQYKHGEDTKYIDIKSYLKYTNKSYTSITEEDVIFLSNLPQKVAIIKGVPVMLTAGPYGLYFKYNGNNVKIPLKFIKKLLDPQSKATITESEYESIIFYKPLEKQANTKTPKGEKTPKPKRQFKKGK